MEKELSFVMYTYHHPTRNGIVMYYKYILIKNTGKITLDIMPGRLASYPELKLSLHKWGGLKHCRMITAKDGQVVGYWYEIQNRIFREKTQKRK